MTRINKLVMNGFKSFGKWTEVPFTNGFNVVLGPNGSGKSCRGDTEVLLADGEIKPIRELVEKALNNSQLHFKLDDGIFTCENPEGIRVLGLDTETMKIAEKDVSAFIKRRGEKSLFKIITKTGRNVTTTGCHPVMVFRNGKIISELVENLEQNDFIATPRRLDLPEKKVSVKGINVDRDFARFIGYLVGDGYVTSNRLEFVNSEDNLLDDFEYLANKFGLTVKYRKKVGNATRIICYGKEFPKLVQHLFRSDSVLHLTCLYKIIPPEIMLSDKSIVANFLAGLFDCDATVRKNNPTFEFTTKNEKLANQIQLSLLRFDIISRKEKKLKYASNTKLKKKNTYFYIIVEGREKLQRFLESIPMRSELKAHRLKKISSKEIKTGNNIDVLPQEVNLLVSECAEILGIMIKPLRNEYPWLAAYNENRCCPTRKSLKIAVDLFLGKHKQLKFVRDNLQKEKANLLAALKEMNVKMNMASIKIGLNKDTINNHWVRKSINLRKKNLENLFAYVKGELDSRLESSIRIISVLSNLSLSHVFWDRISKIEKTPEEEWVYDLTIPNCHNFIGNGIFVHNSNILDALCFVLGRMSSKSMRAEKLGYLVYNGGKTKKPAGKAEVSIFFDNADKIFPVEAPHVKVSRLVKPDGQSIYRINDERRTRQQVLDLLSIAHIDPDGYNIVLQGDIIRFVEMTAEERRQVIEEIAGISVYEDKKQKAMNELDKVDQSLREADIILSEKKEHLKELKQDRDQAIKYKDLNDKLRQNKATLLSIQVRKKEAEKSQIEKSMSDNSQDVSKQKEDIHVLKSLVDAKKKEAVEVVREIEEKGEAEQVKLHKEIEELRVGIGTANSRTSMCDIELQKILVKRDGLKSDLADLEAKIKNLETEKSALEKARTDRLLDKTRIESSIERIRQDNKVANIGDLEIEIEAIEKDLDQKQSETQGLVERKQSLLREKDRLEVQIQSIDSQISKMAELEKENKKELDLVKSKREEFKALVLSLNQALNEDSSFAARIADSKRRLAAAEEELSKAKAKTIVKMELNLPVQKVMEQKERIKGIYGTVSELGKVQSKYSLALEVAAGPRVNSIVVQNEDVAAECIRFLKSNRYGVASFLPLTKLRQDFVEQSKFSKANGVYGLAMDLVSYDPKFKKVFSYVFGNTLVVESIDVAKRIGVGEARMVSIDGDLTELSGAMHGGFRMRKQNSFQEEEVEKELSEKEARVRQLDETVELLEKQRLDNEAKITSFKQRKAEIEGEIIKIERSLSLESADYDASIKQKDSISATIKDVDLQLKSVQESLNEKNRLIADIKTRKQKLRDHISELRNPAVVAELNAFEQKRRQLIEEIMGMDNQVKHIDVQVREVFSVEKEKIASILKQLVKEEEQFNSEKSGLKDKLEQSRKLLKDAEEKSTTFHKKYRELFDTKTKLAEEITKAEEKIIRKEDQINNTEVKINNLSLKNAEVAGELGGLKRDFEQYSDVHLLESATEDQIKEHLYRYERTLSEMGNVNLKALVVYDDVEKQYNQLLEKKETLVSEKADVLKLMEEIEVRKKELFMNTFNVINENFIKIFKDLSTKGEARLIIEDETRLFETGVRVRVNLSGEKFLDIRGLSGGEKSMTALAFIFSIQEYSPASFYIFDEVDAALDKKNSEKLSMLIKKYSDRAQYIVISHNDNVLISAETLFGISMDEHGISNLVSLKV